MLQPDAAILEKQRISSMSEPRKRGSGADGDRIFRRLTFSFAAAVLLVLGLMIFEMTKESLPSISRFGWSFIKGSNWDAVQGDFAALPFLYGSVVSSILAILLATPLSVATALFITEVAPKRVGAMASSLIELLAAIPSVIYGLWGILVMAPWLQTSIQPWFVEHLGFLPFFSGAPYGVSMMAGVLILAIMIIPIITAISREVLLAVPQSQREAAVALGATKWETIRMAVLPYGRSGVIGGVILGLGRAIGETMAVTMVIGNTPQISLSLLSPAYTMPSVIANEFAEATNALHSSALMEIGLLLLLVTLAINVLARILIWKVTKGQKGGV
jgi:phosphate transport system permease protein